MSGGTRTVSPEQVAERLRKEERVLVVTHEAPDGDALGCVSAFLQACANAEIPCTAYIPGEARVPDEYSFLPLLEEVQRGTAPRVGRDVTVYFLDCATPLRGGSDGFSSARTRVNIDHHQDNPGYGDLNLVDAGAPSTTAVLYEIFKAGELAVTPEIATALYVGLVTDTGRFQYSNTTPQAHVLASKLQEAGCDVNAVSQEVYENTPLPRMLLLGRMLGRLEVRLEGRLVVSWLRETDFVETGAHEGHGEGLIDVLRTTRGARVAALARERTKDGSLESKVSLRAKDDGIDVAEVAHEQGGGGHVRAAGFTCEGSAAEALHWVEREVGARL